MEKNEEIKKLKDKVKLLQKEVRELKQKVKTLTDTVIPSIFDSISKLQWQNYPEYK